jgi:hypothetical protein
MVGCLMDFGMARVIERFPDHAAAIRGRFHADQTFREICGDYSEALKALQRWQASSGPQTAARVEEYRELARALEIEIVTALRSPPPGAPNPSWR